MKQKLIIITGKQGSGKTTLANKLAEKYKWRRPYEKEEEDADVLEYEGGSVKLINTKKRPIIVVSKNYLLVLLKNLITDSELLIIDLDVDLKQLNK